MLVGKAHVRPADARRIIRYWADLYQVVDTSFAALASAVDLSVDHNLTIWHAMIFCVAAEVGCRYLISEHMQHGFTWRGLTIINPFSQEGDRTLCAVLDIER